MLTRLRAAIADERARRFAWVAWLVVIGGVLGFYKIALTAHTYWTNMDGGTYIDIAAHVRDGRGLVTACSPNHSGYPYFPFPTANYPLWPLFVGVVAKVFPIVDTGKWLATACYFATLVFGYLWASTLFPKPLFPRFVPGLGAGHVFVLMIGLHDFFFKFTSFPYTEGLSYAIICAALWRMTRLLPRPTWLGGLEVGAWCGLAILARYQNLLLAMATFPVLVGAAVLSTGPRRRYAAMTLAAAAAMLAVVAPHYLYVRSFTPQLTPALYVQWQRVHVSEGLSGIPDVIEVPGALDWALDRLKGFQYAFDPRDERVGYFMRYYTFCYAIVLAVPLLAWLGLKAAFGGKVTAAGLSGVGRNSVEGLAAAWAWARRPENLNWVFVLAFSVGCFVMIHALHMHSFYPEWYFAQRHAIVCVFVFFLSLVLLLRQEGWFWRALGVLVLCSGTVIGIGHIHGQERASEGGRPSTGLPGIARWLNDEAARRGDLVVVFRQPQTFMYETPHVGYHWYSFITTFPDIRRMIALGASYLVVPGGQSYGFMHAPGFAKSFHLAKTVDGYRIYEPIAPAPPKPAPAPPAPAPSATPPAPSTPPSAPPPAPGAP